MTSSTTISKRIPFAAALVASAGFASASIEPVWVTISASASPQALVDAVTDHAGNTFIVHDQTTGGGPTDVDIGLMRFNPDGSLAWERSFAGPIGQDIAAAVTLSWDGSHVLVLGRSSVPGFGNSDFTVLKYDAETGDLLWSRFLDGGDLGIDSPKDIASSPDGGVLVVGGVDTPSEQRDFGTFKLDAEGNQLWFSKFTGFGPFLFENDDAKLVRVNADGKVFVSGDAMQGNNNDIVTLCYDGQTGNQLWQAIYSTSASDNARDLEIAPDGNIVMLGQDPFGSDHQWAFAKYDANTGDLLWDARVDPGQDEHIADLLVASDGTVYAAGATDPDFDDSNSNENLIVVSLDGKTGARNWMFEFGDFGINDFDIGSQIIESNSGTLIVSGYTASDSLVSNPFDFDALLLELDPSDGSILDQELLDTTVPGESIQRESFYRLGKDNQGRIYASGARSVDTGTPQIVLAQYSPGFTTKCLADTNHDGVLTPADFTAWIAAFNAMAPDCDQNNDSACTPADFTAWIANYNAGC